MKSPKSNNNYLLDYPIEEKESKLDSYILAIATSSIIECKSKFSSSSLNKFIEHSGLSTKKDFGDLYENEISAQNENLIIYHHRRDSRDTIDNFSVNEENFLDKSFIHLMNSVTIVKSN